MPKLPICSARPPRLALVSIPRFFPLLLAPLTRCFGLNLVPMKIEQVLFFVLALVAIYFYWRRDLGPVFTIALVAILGFSPHFWAAKDNVLSDLPFLAFFYITANLVRRIPDKKPLQWRWATLVGTSLYLAIGTRTAGIALIPGLILYDVVKNHSIRRITAVALSTCAVLLLIQDRWIGSEFNGYEGHLHSTLDTVGRHLISYPRTLAGFWVSSRHDAFAFLLLAVILLFTLAGLFYRSKEGLTVLEFFLLPYAAIVILWPYSPGIRLAFPFVPWIVFLALNGLRGLAEKFAPRQTSAAACAFLLLIAVPYVQAYRHTDFGPIRQSSGSPEFNQLCAAVRERTSPQDVLIYLRARALALYTGRTASAYNFEGTDEELWLYARDIHATHLIVSNAFDEDHGFLARFAKEHSASLELTYENVNFSLYRILTISQRATVAESR